MQMDYGWFGLAGVFAVIFVASVVTAFIRLLQLYTWQAWTTLYASEVAAFLALLLLALILAKVLATVVHLLVTFCKILQYRNLLHSAVHAQDSVRRDGKVQKVLICHASVGAGHTRAAQALAAAIQRLDDTVRVKVVDLMEPPYADRTLIYFYKDWYLRLVGGHTLFGELGTHCVGFLFDRANSVQNSFSGGNALQRRLTQSFLLNFLHLVCDMKPDVVVHTHFLAPELLASLRRRHGLRVPHITVVTDMDVHAWWYQQPTDHYFVPRSLAKYQLHSDGVPESDITISGIPIMPQFSDALNDIRGLDSDARRQRFLAQMDAPLDPSLFDAGHRPLIVQMSTGRSVEAIYKNLLNLETPIALVVVCGRQADSRSSLERIRVPQRHRVALLGFTSCIHELLAVADAVVTKPGGLITSEALACGNMVVVVDPYPGQEERNASMLLEEGAGIWIWDYKDIPPKLDAIFSASSSRFSLSAYQENARRLAKPDAAFVVARYVLSELPWKRMMRDSALTQEVTEDSLPRRSSSILFGLLGEEDTPPRRFSPEKLRLEMGDLNNLIDMQAMDDEDESDGTESSACSEEENCMQVRNQCL
mmetsp:Transcript_22413/g.40413  ORF Transcript_22413/g.40413 Transcript_22413/m.40413 type:complete len:591 (-) Transcript_22413:48-1820(-)